MNPIFRNRLVLMAALTLQTVAMLALVGCSDRDLASLEPATAKADPVVFDDAFGADLDYSAFEFSYYDAMTIEDEGGVDDSPTLKITIPAGNWAGGSFWTHSPRDLSSFNALTLSARASGALNLAECGFGIPIAVDPEYQVSISNVPLTETWSQIVVPIPDPARLTSERGMFWFSHGTGDVGIWFDDVKFATVAGITNPRPVMTTESVEALLNETVAINGTKTTFAVNGEDVEVTHMASYFTYFSSDEAVLSATDGVVTAVGGGTATITAKLGDVDVDGEVTVTVIAPPSTPAVTPTVPAGDVISLFSDAYTDIAVDTWRTDWSSQSVSVYDQQIAGDNVKAYVGLNNLAYVGVEFVNEQVDAATAGMTHFHLDVFAPTGTLLTVKLVDFGADGAYGGGDDTEASLNLHSGSTPAFVAGQWSSLDIPLANFTGLNTGHLSQLILQSTNIGNVWIDNVYFHK